MDLTPLGNWCFDVILIFFLSFGFVAVGLLFLAIKVIFKLLGPVIGVVLFGGGIWLLLHH